MSNQVEKVTISVNLINAILQYLASKPFSEVNQLIGGLYQETNGAAAPTAKPTDVKSENEDTTTRKAPLKKKHANKAAA